MRNSTIGAAAAVFLTAGSAMSLPVHAAEAQPVSAQETAAHAAAVQRHINAYRARDLDAFTATFAPDAIVVANGIPARGRAQIRSFYAANFAPDAPTVRVNASYMSDDGGSRRLYMETAYILSDGQEMCCSQTFYTVKNGLITRLDVTS
ncbi:MAG: nuclear transport factor 2 family protein [Erythrobacter sp.]